jgi:hypothetical protein
VGGWVGCSQNSLTTRFPALLGDLPQVKRGTSHSWSEPMERPASLPRRNRLIQPAMAEGATTSEQRRIRIRLVVLARGADHLHGLV